MEGIYSCFIAKYFQNGYFLTKKLQWQQPNMRDKWRIVSIVKPLIRRDNIKFWIKVWKVKPYLSKIRGVNRLMGPFERIKRSGVYSRIWSTIKSWVFKLLLVINYTAKNLHVVFNHNTAFQSKFRSCCAYFILSFKYISKITITSIKWSFYLVFGLIGVIVPDSFFVSFGLSEYWHGLY